MIKEATKGISQRHHLSRSITPHTTQVPSIGKVFTVTPQQVNIPSLTTKKMEVLRNNFWVYQGRKARKETEKDPLQLTSMNTNQSQGQMNTKRMMP